MAEHYHVYKLEANLCVESTHADPVTAFQEWLQSERTEGVQALVTTPHKGVFAVGIKPEPLQPAGPDPFTGLPQYQLTTA